MKKYIASPNAEVIGSAMQNLFITLGGNEIKPFVDQVLESYQVKTIENDQWYPHQLSLDIFKLIADNSSNSYDRLMALGTAYVETATFPPNVTDVFTGLTTLSQTYHLNIRNVPATEGYEVSQHIQNYIHVKDLNPFPHPTVYGFIRGIVKRFRRSSNSSLITPSIQQTLFNPHAPDEDGASYTIVLLDR